MLPIDNMYVHTSTGNGYYVRSLEVTNATNAQDGQAMVLYQREGELYVRENQEFMERFKQKIND